MLVLHCRFGAGLPHGGQPLTLVATIKNVGDTEARDVSVSSALVTGYYNSDADALKKAPLLFSGQPDTRLIVSSGESFKKNLASRTLLASEDYANLMNGKMKAYFFSEMTYSDVMGALHQGHICEYFDPSESAMVPCPTQNSSNYFIVEQATYQRRNGSSIWVRRSVTNTAHMQ